MNEDELRQTLLFGLEVMHMEFQRHHAIAWLVLSYCTDEDSEELDFSESIVGTYGPFASPEEALVQAGKHDASSEEGFRNVIVPLYPPIQWKDEQ